VSVRQFDVFANSDPRSRNSRPYFIVLQSDQLDQFDTRIVAPLVAPSKILNFERLMPEFEISGKIFVLLPQQLGAYPVRAMKRVVANLEAERYRLIGALDLLFTGI
jgi:toxin CcdB